MPSQRSGHHPRTRISLPGCLKFKERVVQTNRVTPNNVPFHPVLTVAFLSLPYSHVPQAGRKKV
nr:MAG TPA: hypothetical protein [Caudoviricetes sp.]